MINFRMTLLFLLSLCFVNVLAAQTCEANLASIGNPKDGLTFTSSVSLRGLTPHSAIGQIKGIVVADPAFELGADSYQGSNGTLEVIQKATAKSRAISMYFTANEQGVVAFKAVLPASMSIKLADASDYLCGKWIDKLQAGSRGDALAEEGEKLGHVQKPVVEAKSVLPTAELTSSCEANFTSKGAMFPGGYQYGSFVTVPASSTDAILTNLKTVAGPSGYKVAEERQVGNEKQMLLAATKGGKPIVVTVDTHNGNFGIGVPTNPPPVWQLELGPAYASKGILSEPPRIGPHYPLLAPAVDRDGNERGGWRGAMSSVPLGTYTAWDWKSRNSPLSVISPASMAPSFHSPALVPNA